MHIVTSKRQESSTYKNYRLKCFITTTLYKFCRVCRHEIFPCKPINPFSSRISQQHSNFNMCTQSSKRKKVLRGDPKCFKTTIFDRYPAYPIATSRQRMTFAHRRYFGVKFFARQLAIVHQRIFFAHQRTFQYVCTPKISSKNAMLFNLVYRC